MAGFRKANVSQGVIAWRLKKLLALTNEPKPSGRCVNGNARSVGWAAGAERRFTNVGIAAAYSAIIESAAAEPQGLWRAHRKSRTFPQIERQRRRKAAVPDAKSRAIAAPVACKS